MYDTREKTYEAVSQYIKNQILNGDLVVGDKLPPERTLSEDLGISRNSLREAIKTLEIMGAVSSQHGAGNYISCNFEKNIAESLSMMFILNNIDYDEISELRLALEMEAFKLAVSYASDDEAEEICAIAKELSLGKYDKEAVILDKQFHYKIALCSRNQFIIVILSALSEVIDRFITDMRKEILQDEKYKDRLCKAHIGIAESLKDRQIERGNTYVQEHFAIVDRKIKDYKAERNK